MIEEQDILVIKNLITEQLTGRITQMMIPSDTIKQRHVGEGVRFLRSGLASELPTEGELEGATFFATDTHALYFWDGESWGTKGGYTLTFNSGAFNPADSTTYYLGNIGTVGTSQIYVPVPRSGIITNIRNLVYNNGTTGSSETSTLSLGHLVATTGATTYYDFDTVLTTGGSGYDAYPTSITVTEEDKLTIRITCPAFATNPTNVYVYAQVYIE